MGNAIAGVPVWSPAELSHAKVNLAALQAALYQELPFWQWLFRKVYFFLQLRPLLTPMEYLPKAPQIRLRDDERAPDDQPAAAAAEEDEPAAEQEEDEGGEEDQLEEEQQEEAQREAPVLEGIRPLAPDDPRRTSRRTLEYMRWMGVFEVFEAVISGVLGGGEGYAIYQAIGEQTGNEYVIGDTTLPGCAAYIWEAVNARERGNPQLWIRAATVSKEESREHNAYRGKCNHRLADADLPEDVMPAHIRNLKKFLKTH